MGHLSSMPTPWTYLFASEVPGLLSVWQGREHHASQSPFLPRREATGGDEPVGPNSSCPFRHSVSGPRAQYLHLVSISQKTS